jgi:hypothetical protein
MLWRTDDHSLNPGVRGCGEGIPDELTAVRVGRVFAHVRAYVANGPQAGARMLGYAPGPATPHEAQAHHRDVDLGHIDARQKRGPGRSLGREAVTI